MDIGIINEPVPLVLHPAYKRVILFGNEAKLIINLPLLSVFDVSWLLPLDEKLVLPLQWFISEWIYDWLFLISFKFDVFGFNCI